MKTKTAIKKLLKFSWILIASHDKLRVQFSGDAGRKVYPPCFLRSPSSVLLNVTPSLTVTKQYRLSPLTGWGLPTTAASATASCSTRADSTSAVLSRWPEEWERISGFSCRFGSCNFIRKSQGRIDPHKLTLKLNLMFVFKSCLFSENLWDYMAQIMTVGSKINSRGARKLNRDAQKKSQAAFAEMKRKGICG